MLLQKNSENTGDWFAWIRPDKGTITREDVVDTLLAHCQIGAHHDQRGYKEDIFGLFCVCYNAGIKLTGGILHDIIVERIPTYSLDVLHDLCTTWEAWHYAWEHVYLKK
jgi:hypothetical protein